MRGRKPKPLQQHILGGTFRADRHGGVPQPRRAFPRCPDHLDADAKKEWKRLVRELYDLGLMTNLDRATLAGYCAAWSEWVKMSRLLDQTGLLLKSANGVFYQSPMVAIRNRALEQMRQFGGLLGLNPMDRGRVRAAPAPAEDDPLEALLGSA